ncbi:MAG: hypothetical protein L6R42_001916 [Xanthoria sp. 1 TBL-2021]|nr:MAG: hypothetical protein L6R42_001916 [Xanthoria sp. 1 TBL-2021]
MGGQNIRETHPPTHDVRTTPTMPITYDTMTPTNQALDEEVDEGADEEADKEWKRTLVVTDKGVKMRMIKTTTFKFIYYT